jgi:thioesterase domain-containing protein
MSAPVKLSPSDRVRHEVGMLTDHGLGYFGDRVSANLADRFLKGAALDLLAKARPTVARSRRTKLAWFAAARKYEGGPYDGSASLIISKAMGLREQRILAAYPLLGWDALIDAAKIARSTVDCSHLEMVRGRDAEALAELMEARAKRALGQA